MILFLSAAQKLLKKNFPLENKFQVTCLGLTYSFNIESEKCIQLLHNGHSHWITVRTIEVKANEIFFIIVHMKVFLLW